MLRWLYRLLIGEPRPTCRYWYAIESDVGRVEFGAETVEELAALMRWRQDEKAAGYTPTPEHTEA